MKRIKVEPDKKPIGLLTADWHIRADTPKCRIDNFFEAMERKIQFIIDKSNKLDIPILLAGDLGEPHQWPNWLLEWFIDHFNQLSSIPLVIPGQHDLPSHNIDLWRKSGIGVLGSDRTIKLMLGDNQEDYGFIAFSFPYKVKLDKPKKKSKYKLSIAMIHDLIIKDKSEWLDQEATKALSLLKKFPEYDLILSGDNHKTFTVEYQGRLLVNPGSILRLKADQINHKPSIFIWYSDNTVKQVFLPINDKVIDRTYLDKKSLKESAIKSLILDFKKGFKAKFSFEKNLEQHFKKNHTQERVQEKVWEALEK